MTNNDLLTFGLTVRKFRQENNISQEKFADLCGLNRTYIGSVERGERNIGLINIIRIAMALHIHPSDLLKEIGKEDSK